MAAPRVINKNCSAVPPIERCQFAKPK